ncbi:hypothetical protein BDZ45DRAFT_299707 [Acephala macrosclerotiorum]|nr:hypothetical protein BDZ45DRAFT_299707 [Acephala macrosclerotiorum]
MLSKTLAISILAILSGASLATAQVSGCGGGGSFAVSDISENFGGLTLTANSVSITQQGSGQICIVNRAPNTSVYINGGQIDDAIAAILSDCCGSNTFCAGGQFKITADSGNVIDLSVQGLGQNCTP